jgi:hypothetical protein
MTVANNALPSVHDKDPKQVILDALKPHLHKVEVTAADVLTCVYQRPQEIMTSNSKTAIKLVLPDNAGRASEDKFQGIAALVVKLGPAFHSKYDRELGLDPALKVGDWVTYNVGDTSPFVLGDRHMRLVQGNFIRLRISDPDAVI